MEALTQLLYDDKHIRSFIKSLENNGIHHLVTGVTAGARPAFMHTAYVNLHKPIYVLTSNLLQAQRLVEDFNALVGSDNVYYYPADDFIAADMTMASPELRAQRLVALDALAHRKVGVYIIPVAGMRKPLMPIEEWQQHVLETALGQDMELEHWVEQLVVMGYSRVEMATSPGEFALRGGILDIYPPYEDNPLRIELFDTEVDSIRTFSAEDQRSIEKIEAIRILPATEMVFTAEQKLAIAQRLEQALEASVNKVNNADVKQALQENIQLEIEQLRQNIVPSYLNKYGALLYNRATFLGDYFSPYGLVFIDEIGRVQEVMDAWEREEQEWFISLIEEGKMVHDVKVSFTFKEVLAMMPQTIVHFALFARAFHGVTFQNTESFTCKPMQQFQGQIPLFKQEVERWRAEGFTVLFLADGQEHVDKMVALLGDYDLTVTTGMPNGKGLYALDLPLKAGFELTQQRLAVVTEDELFKLPAKKRTRPQKMTNAERIKSYTEMKVGDYIVHVQHGIGKYMGVETVEVGGLHRDYLNIHYRGDDKLYVPIDQIDLIQKYVGSEEREPKLHKLGGTEWKRTKAKVTKAVMDIADDLIKLYAKREAEKGFAFSPDSDDMRAFEAAFPYEETEDQLRTIVEVKADMERERPMDRLVCGDVGYGKTEVAIRGAFKAIMDGKQVAFLVPTTILAQQHFETIKERFADFPITVGLLSRFRTRKQQTETLRGLKDGTVDIVIGTHRLLSKDVVYNDLGLLIVDEEQRFGVTHKEKIKQLKTNVDVLTLTATPIPRTLHMSMVGVRDLSVIETPPANRFPVQTYVMEYSGALIREAIEREMSRGGQVFYLFNRVAEMARKVEEIQQLVPEARVGYAHGRMTETELEEVILAFLEGDYDVLVTTTIIETGVDIPNVNTLIVHDADKMGLSQLYQLRGRVGRSNRVAYAYFTYQREKVLSEVAESRLQAIKEFTELGSGFKIAMRDLSIRGAGDLLGSQQHGFIDSVGFDLYSQMLEEAIEERQLGDDFEEKVDIEIVIPMDAYIPDAYIPDGYQKIQMYKRIKGMESEEDYLEIGDELVDRFGDIPSETVRLLRVARLKAWGLPTGLRAIKLKQQTITINFTDDATKKFDVAEVMQASNKYGRAIGFGMEAQTKSLVMTIDEKQLPKTQLLFDVVEDIMKMIYDNRK